MTFIKKIIPFENVPAIKKYINNELIINMDAEINVIEETKIKNILKMEKKRVILKRILN